MEKFRFFFSKFWKISFFSWPQYFFKKNRKKGSIDHNNWFFVTNCHFFLIFCCFGHNVFSKKTFCQNIFSKMAKNCHNFCFFSNFKKLVANGHNIVAKFEAWVRDGNFLLYDNKKISIFGQAKRAGKIFTSKCC